MARGLAYDSEEGRDYAASITALMTGQAYLRSAQIATIKGAFAGFEANREAMLEVIHKHFMHIPDITKEEEKQRTIWSEANIAWSNAYRLGEQHGYRNAQVSLLAPTGTVSFMMDCDTTGIEPAIALVSHKKLVGGGTVKHVNGVVERAMQTLGYDEKCIVYAKKSVEDGHGIYTYVKPGDFKVFDCAFPGPEGKAISPEGHIRMVAAVQPFLSGSVSKTINLPNSATVEDIEGCYLLGWKLGCKSLAVYRDGCKATQVLSTHADAPAVSDVDLPKHAHTAKTVHEYRTHTDASDVSGAPTSAGGRGVHKPIPQRRRLPDERQAITHKASIGGHEMYLTIGLYEDGTPGEMFLRMAKEGSTISGLMDAFATAISISLQYGVPLEALVQKFQGSRFEPAGFTQNKAIPIAKSIMDYIFRYLEQKFLAPSKETQPNVCAPEVTETLDKRSQISVIQTDVPLCSECGSLTRRNGSCFVCESCGGTTGCS
jgi:ribonucleoside-diphosphate reductase alpha chain